MPGQRKEDFKLEVILKLLRGVFQAVQGKNCTVPQLSPFLSPRLVLA